MTFWQENYSFIKEVYDTRYAKMAEWMDNVEMAVQKVLASRVYTSAEFKREKDNFHVSIYSGYCQKWIFRTLNTDILTTDLIYNFFNISLCARTLKEQKPSVG